MPAQRSRRGPRRQVNPYLEIWVKVYVAATDQLIGTLTNNGGGRLGQLLLAEQPGHHPGAEQPGVSTTKAIVLK